MFGFLILTRVYYICTTVQSAVISTLQHNRNYILIYDDITWRINCRNKKKKTLALITARFRTVNNRGYHAVNRRLPRSTWYHRAEPGVTRRGSLRRAVSSWSERAVRRRLRFSRDVVRRISVLSSRAAFAENLVRKQTTRAAMVWKDFGKFQRLLLFTVIVDMSFRRRQLLLLLLFSAVAMIARRSAAAHCSDNLFPEDEDHLRRSSGVRLTKELSANEYGPMESFKTLHCCGKNYLSLEWWVAGAYY